jgi:hypothetical protein
VNSYVAPDWSRQLVETDVVAEADVIRVIDWTPHDDPLIERNSI